MCCVLQLARKRRRGFQQDELHIVTAFREQNKYLYLIELIFQKCETQWWIFKCPLLLESFRWYSYIQLAVPTKLSQEREGILWSNAVPYKVELEISLGIIVPYTMLNYMLKQKRKYVFFSTDFSYLCYELSPLHSHSIPVWKFYK